MATISVSVPVPSANGTGAPVDIATLDWSKTLTVEGDLNWLALSLF